MANRAGLMKRLLNLGLMVWMTALFAQPSTLLAEESGPHSASSTPSTHSRALATTLTRPMAQTVQTTTTLSHDKADIVIEGIHSAVYPLNAGESLFQSLLQAGSLEFPGELFGMSDGQRVMVEMLEPIQVAQANKSSKAKASNRGPRATAGGLSKVEIELVVIYATNDKQGFDPRLSKFKKQLSILAFSGFDLMSKEKFILSMDQTKKTALFEGKVVETTLLSGDESRVQLRLRLLKPAPNPQVVLKTQLSIPRNGTFFVGGPKYKSGVLILPVTARY